jgi:hypothetical protein
LSTPFDPEFFRPRENLTRSLIWCGFLRIQVAPAPAARHSAVATGRVGRRSAAIRPASSGIGFATLPQMGGLIRSAAASARRLIRRVFLSFGPCASFAVQSRTSLFRHRPRGPAILRRIRPPRDDAGRLCAGRSAALVLDNRYCRPRHGPRYRHPAAVRGYAEAPRPNRLGPGAGIRENPMRRTAATFLGRSSRYVYTTIFVGTIAPAWPRQRHRDSIRIIGDAVAERHRGAAMAGVRRVGR